MHNPNSCWCDDAKCTGRLQFHQLPNCLWSQQQESWYPIQDTRTTPNHPFPLITIPKQIKHCLSFCNLSLYWTIVFWSIQQCRALIFSLISTYTFWKPRSGIVQYEWQFACLKTVPKLCCRRLMNMPRREEQMTLTEESLEPRARNLPRVMISKFHKQGLGKHQMQMR
jgi:hypothetical protein